MIIYIDIYSLKHYIIRSICETGDVFLKPHVISEPDVTFTRRDVEDDFVIVASDGMWDVIPTEMAGRVASQCLKEPLSPQAEHDVPCRSTAAAALLTRLAMARSSVDNISVVVVDLKVGRARAAN